MKSKMTESSSYWSPGSDSVLSNEESSTRTFHRTTSAQVNIKLTSRKDSEREKRKERAKVKEREKRLWRKKKRERKKRERGERRKKREKRKV